MKRLLFILLCLPLAASATEVQCPKFYPWEDTLLAEVPYKHSGKGVVAREELSSASAMWGDFNTPAEYRGGPERKVKGGFDVVMPPTTRWLVCWYGKGRTVSWWEELKHDPKRVKQCVLKIRDKSGSDPMDIRFTCL